MRLYKKISTYSAAMVFIFAASDARSANIRTYSAFEYLTSEDVQYLSIGARVEFDYLTLEVSNGIKKSSRRERGAHKISNGTLLSLHLYPFHSRESKNRFLLSVSHLSDLFRGKPFNDKEEPVDHFFGAGYSTKLGKYEADLMIGKESHDCSLDTGCDYSNQIKATIRYFF